MGTLPNRITNNTPVIRKAIRTFKLETSINVKENQILFQATNINN
jgi:hypothetical protein